jgi:hypothetical protein
VSRNRVEQAARAKPIVYVATWGAWIKSNVVRDLRSGVLRVNAEGATIY